MLSADAAAALREKLNEFGEPGAVPLTLAQRLIKASAWWHGHPQSPARAPKWAEHVFKGPYGLEVKFGSNTFLVERAVILSKGRILQALDQAVASNGPIDGGALRGRLVNCVRESVADVNGICDYYQGGATKKIRHIRRSLRSGQLNSEGKPIEPLRGFMHFGSNAIKVDDFVEAIWQLADLKTVCT